MFWNSNSAFQSKIEYFQLPAWPGKRFMNILYWRRLWVTVLGWCSWRSPTRCPRCRCRRSGRSSSSSCSSVLVNTWIKKNTGVICNFFWQLFCAEINIHFFYKQNNAPYLPIILSNFKFQKIVKIWKCVSEVYKKQKQKNTHIFHYLTNYQEPVTTVFDFIKFKMSSS